MIDILNLLCLSGPSVPWLPRHSQSFSGWEIWQGSQKVKRLFIIGSILTFAFARYLTRKIGFEAVMRIRCTRGMSLHTFHGHFFVRYRYSSLDKQKSYINTLLTDPPTFSVYPTSILTLALECRSPLRRIWRIAEKSVSRRHYCTPAARWEALMLINTLIVNWMIRGRDESGCTHSASQPQLVFKKLFRFVWYCWTI